MGTNTNGLSRALFTKTQQRVLGLLFGNPDRSYYAKELVRLAGSGTGAVQRELEKLTKAGLLSVKKIGNQKHYQANRNSPIFDELHRITVKTFGVADVLRRGLDPVSDRIQVALIFGSVASGTDTADSDIDILIVSGSLSHPDLFGIFAEAEQELGRSVSPAIYSPEEFRSKLESDNAFFARLLKQPVIFLIGSDGDFERTGKPGQNR
jgi:predicted nucleotidyltransferase